VTNQEKYDCVMAVKRGDREEDWTQAIRCALDLLQDNRTLTDEEWRAMVSRLLSHQLALQV